MDTDLSTLFVKRFGVDSHLSMPNVDAMYIKTLLEEGAYKEACEKLIDYYGENSVTALNWKIHDLKDELEQVGNECDDLRRSNEAEHREKVQFWEKAEEAARLVRRFLDFDIRGSSMDCLPMRELLNDSETFINNNKELLP